MTITKAIKTLNEIYEWAKKQSFVRDPVAYALYHAWKAADEAGRKK